MKYFIPLLTLAVLVVACNSSELQMQNFTRINVGSQRPGDYLLERMNVVLNPSPNVVQSVDRTYRGGSRTYISAVHAYQVGLEQFSSGRILSGGVGFNHVTVRLQSGRGFGMNVNVDIFGRN